MHNRLDILRVPPAPLGTPMYVYDNKTSVKTAIYSNRACTVSILQPKIMEVKKKNLGELFGDKL